jgi:WXXGXW repeat (2 copies)
MTFVFRASSVEVVYLIFRRWAERMGGVSTVRRLIAFSFAFALAASLLSHAPAALAQIDVSISVDAEPPPLPVYEQPPIPDPGYIWVPGYWAWSEDVGYYWVPGTWVMPPQADLLWTPGYWGWDDGVYIFQAGYWGPVVGFYGGIAYGCGYTGFGYEGGYWRDHQFFYNRTVNNITNVSITNVYNKTVINNTMNVSYNGGPRGAKDKPTPEQIASAKEHHIAPTAEQSGHADAAKHDPALYLTNNHGHPLVAGTSHVGQFKGAGIVASRPGEAVVAPPPRHGPVTSARISPGPNDASHALPVPAQPPAKSASSPASHALPVPPAPPIKNAAAPANHASPPSTPQAAISTASAPANRVAPVKEQMVRRPPPVGQAPKPQPVRTVGVAPPPPHRMAPPVHIARVAPPPRPAPQRRK